MTTVLTGVFEDYLYAASDSRRKTGDGKIHDFEDNGDKYFYAQKTIVSIAGTVAPFALLKSMFVDELVTMPQLESGFKELGERVMHKAIHYIGKDLQRDASSTIWFMQKDRDIHVELDLVKKTVEVTITHHDSGYNYNRSFGSGMNHASMAYNEFKAIGHSLEDRLNAVKAAIEYASEFDKGTGGKINVMFISTKENELGNFAATNKTMLEIY